MLQLHHSYTSHLNGGMWLRRSYTSHNPGCTWQLQATPPQYYCETTATSALHHSYPGYNDSYVSQNPSYVTGNPSYDSYNHGYAS